MKKYLIIISLILFPATVFAATFNSAQLGSGASDGYVLKSNGATSTWVATSTLGISGGSGTPAGSGTEVQFRNGSAFGATSTFTYSSSTATLQIGSSTLSSTAQGNLLLQAPEGFYNSIFSIGNIAGYFENYHSNRACTATSSTDLIIGSDLNSLDASSPQGFQYYGDIGINSSCNSDPLYTGFNGANQMYIYNQDAGLSLATATSSASSTITFLTGGTLTANERMRITSTGNVGIGSSSPTSKLSIQGTSGSQNTIFAVASSTGSQLFSVLPGGNVGIGTTTSAMLSVVGTTTIYDQLQVKKTGTVSSPSIQIGSTSNTGFYTNGSTFVGISSSGVGAAQFGSTGVSYFLPISMGSGAAYLSTGTASQSAPSYSFFSDTNTGIWEQSADTLDFTTGGTNRLSINSIGNISLGTTSTSTGYRLDVSGGAIVNEEVTIATSSSMRVSFASSTAQLVKIGTSAITLNLQEAIPGGILRLTVCNPAGASGGAITWASSSTLHWSGTTAPTQTTTAGLCDLWTFSVTAGTSSSFIWGTQIPW